jgi:hypothetical protein
VDRVQAARRNAETALAALSGDPEVYRGEGWRWRVRREGSVVAEGGRGFGTPEEAREAFRSLSVASETGVVECETAVEVAPADGEWGLRIRANDGRVLGTGSKTYDCAGDALEAASNLVGGPVVTEDGSGTDTCGEPGE